MFLHKVGCLIAILGSLGFFLFVTPAFAHVIVYPQQVGVAATQDFTVSVPNERDNPVVSARLLVPKGFQSVIPNATQGWTITTKSREDGNNAIVAEIDWTGGSIPAGQREEFTFQAQAPAQQTTLIWKAYQTYSDGIVVSWDVNPQQMEKLPDEKQDELASKENKGEYSTTQVINDLASRNIENNSVGSSQSVYIAEFLSGIAIILSVAALFISLKRRK